MWSRVRIELLRCRPSLLEGEGEEAAAQSASYFIYYIPMHFTKGKATSASHSDPQGKHSMVQILRSLEDYTEIWNKSKHKLPVVFQLYAITLAVA